MKTSKAAKVITSENVIRRGLKRVLNHLEPDELCDFANEIEHSEKFESAVNDSFNGDASSLQTLNDLTFVCDTARDVKEEKGGCHLEEIKDEVPDYLYSTGDICRGCNSRQVDTHYQRCPTCDTLWFEV